MGSSPTAPTNPSGMDSTDRFRVVAGDLPAKSRVTGSSPGGRSAGESAIPTRPSRRHPSRPQARATRGAPAVAPSPPDWGLGRRWPGGLGSQRSRPHRWGPTAVLLPDGWWRDSDLQALSPRSSPVTDILAQFDQPTGGPFVFQKPLDKAGI